MTPEQGPASPPPAETSRASNSSQAAAERRDGRRRALGARRAATVAGQARGRLSTGIAGLDEVLRGGLVPGRAYLLRGGPGTGKTMLGLHYLAAGAAQGETTLFITLDESEKAIRENARSVGMDLAGIEFLDLSPSSEFFRHAESYDIFTPAEVEREPTTRKIVEEVERLHPQRVVLEGMTQFRYLAPDTFQFHKQVLSFLRFLVDQGATVLFTSEASAAAPDDDLQFVSDGVIQLTSESRGRNIEVVKFRGSDFHAGRHSLRITRSGVQVFPRLVPDEHLRQFVQEPISSGIAELDELIGGGLERGTVTAISGPTGVGKTTLALYFMKEAAGRGERSVIYTFEEGVETLARRAEAVNVPVRSMLQRGTLSINQIDALRYTPDELAFHVREEVEQRGAQIVMLDSLAGYQLCIVGDDLVRRIHALCNYLKNMGVTVLLINEIESITGEFRATEAGISYLTDNIVFLRYIEVDGQLRRAIGVLKKRVSGFENTLRELEISRFGIKVGPPLTEFRGLLSGQPAPIRNRPENGARLRRGRPR